MQWGREHLLVTVHFVLWRSSFVRKKVFSDGDLAVGQRNSLSRQPHHAFLTTIISFHKGTRDWNAALRNSFGQVVEPLMQIWLECTPQVTILFFIVTNSHEMGSSIRCLFSQDISAFTPKNVNHMQVCGLPKYAYAYMCMCVGLCVCIFLW